MRKSSRRQPIDAGFIRRTVGGVSSFVMVTRLLHTRYRVADLDKTVGFYTDVLGMSEVRRGSTLVLLAP